jgi:hypothetical protein
VPRENNAAPKSHQRIDTFWKSMARVRGDAFGVKEENKE